MVNLNDYYLGHATNKATSSLPTKKHPCKTFLTFPEIKLNYQLRIQER